MKRIELLGPSGVGKTTLYNRIYLETDPGNKSFLTHWEAYEKVAEKKDIPFKSLKRKLYQAILKSGILPQKRRGIAKLIVASGYANGSGFNRDEYKNFDASIKVFLKRLSKKPNPYVVRSEIERLVQRIDEFLILEKEMDKNVAILFDEGMLHKHGGLNPYTLKKFDRDRIFTDRMLIPAGIVSCEQSADIIFEQALQRRNRGILTFSHGHLSEQELYEKTKSDVNYHHEMIGRYENLGVPILKIDIRDDFAEIVSAIDGFISSLPADRETVEQNI